MLQSEAAPELLNNDGASTPVLYPALRKLVATAATSDLPVLLTGETGTGKTVLARLIHQLSDRARASFVHVNCAAVPAELFEREMFGNVRGAFTDAREARSGLFETASRGTLFLDEIAEVPGTAQAKLLTAIESSIIRRLGAAREIPVDIRLITATNANVSEALRSGRLRQDLYHRCAVIHIHLPPLRERRKDLPAIVRQLLLKITGGQDVSLGDPVWYMLQEHSWPGNIRELENVLQRAWALRRTESSSIVDLHVGTGFYPQSKGQEITTRRKRRYVAPPPPEERRMIQEALAAEYGNRTKAAKRLGMSRSSLWMKMKIYGLYELPDDNGAQ